jgi:ribonuclease Z
VNINLSTFSFKPGKWIRDLKEMHEKKTPDAWLEIEGTRYQAKELFAGLEVTKGYRFGFIMDFLADAANEAKISDLFYEADQVMIEAYYRQEEWELAVKNYHSTASRSGEIARKAKIKEAIPIHFSRRHHSAEANQALMEEFYRAFNG